MLLWVRFPRMLGLVEVLQLLRMQLSDDKGVVLKEQGAAIHPCGKGHGGIPLSEVLHKLPTAGRKRVGRLMRPQCSERQQ